MGEQVALPFEMTFAEMLRGVMATILSLRWIPPKADAETAVDYEAAIADIERELHEGVRV